MQTYLIEPQKIFVPAISAILLEAGLEIVCVIDRLDFRNLMETSPSLIFADLDFFQAEIGQSVQIMRTLLPDVVICVYTSNYDEQRRNAYRAVGADGVFSKSLSRFELVRALQNLLSTMNGSHAV